MNFAIIIGDICGITYSYACDLIVSEVRALEITTSSSNYKLHALIYEKSPW